jgi:hypothetical protein
MGRGCSASYGNLEGAIANFLHRYHCSSFLGRFALSNPEGLGEET